MPDSSPRARTRDTIPPRMHARRMHARTPACPARAPNEGVCMCPVLSPAFSGDEVVSDSFATEVYNGEDGQDFKGAVLRCKSKITVSVSDSGVSCLAVCV